MNDTCPTRIGRVSASGQYRTSIKYLIRGRSQVSAHP
ncbi:unnamed protein product, partial [Urochloa humidicola]